MQPDPIQAAADAARTGAVICYPTDTLWGLGASLSRPDAVREVFRLKQRPAREPLSLAVASVSDIGTYAHVTPTAKRLFGLLPGALTLVLRRRANVPDAVTGGSDTVGMRVPDHPTCLQLLARAGPLTSTSANVHGQPDPKTLEEVRSIFGPRVGFYLAGDMPPGGTASTVVDATSDSVRILRPGAIRESRILQLLHD